MASGIKFNDAPDDQMTGVELADYYNDYVRHGHLELDEIVNPEIAEADPYGDYPDGWEVSDADL